METLAICGGLEIAMKIPEYSGLENLLDNLEKYRIPTGKKDMAWLDSADAARKSLCEIWELARNNCVGIYQELNVRPDDVQDISDMMSLGITADHLAHIAIKPITNPASVPDFSAWYETEPANPSKPNVAPPTKPKPKTRPTGPAKDLVGPMQDLAMAHPLIPLTLLAEPIPAISIYTLKKATSLKTISLLFPSPSDTARGSVSWTGLITTLADAGFSGQHRRGSEWTIHTDDAKSEEGAGHKRSIVTHQPHQEPRMSAAMLQRLGRRFERRFGWRKEMFGGRCD